MADITVNVEASFDLNKILKQFDKLTEDEKVWMSINNLFAKLIEPWVPMDNGILAHGYEITPQHIRYPGPYAHYQYMGEKYGPNIPLYDDAGQLIGFYSPPKKYPTGEDLIYNKEKHERASKEWDKAAYPVIKDQFIQGVKEILIRRLREINANS